MLNLQQVIQNVVVIRNVARSYRKASHTAPFAVTLFKTLFLKGCLRKIVFHKEVYSLLGGYHKRKSREVARSRQVDTRKAIPAVEIRGIKVLRG